MKIRSTSTALAILLGTSACQKEETITPAPSALKSASLETMPALPEGVGVKWMLVHLSTNTPIDERRRPWFILEQGGRLTGHTGCNTVSGRYILRGDEFNIVDLLSTRIQCPELAQQEDEFLNALRSAEDLKVNDGQLALLIGRFELARFEDPRQ